MGAGTLRRSSCQNPRRRGKAGIPRRGYRNGPTWSEYESVAYHVRRTDQPKQHFVFAEPVKDIRTMKMIFPFPDQGPLYASKVGLGDLTERNIFRCLYRLQPSSYISHLLGHEGPGSVLSCLKRRGWSSALSAGCDMDTVGFDFFTVRVDLTLEGLCE